MARHDEFEIEEYERTGLDPDRAAIVTSVIVAVISLLICISLLYLKFSPRARARKAKLAKEKLRENNKGISISIYANDLLLSKGPVKFILENVSVLSEVANKCNLYLFFQVEHDKDIASILEGLEQCGAFKGGLKKHRVLFSKTSSGRASMIRQLKPALHMESDPTVIATIKGKIANITQFKVVQGESSIDDEKQSTEDDSVLHVKSIEDISNIVMVLIAIQ